MTGTEKNDFALGELIDALKACPNNWTVVFDYIGNAGSSTPTTAGQVYQLLNGAIGKFFCGWKGGTYRMTRSTRVWATTSSTVSNRRIVGITEGAGGLVIQTELRRHRPDQAAAALTIDGQGNASIMPERRRLVVVTARFIGLSHVPSYYCKDMTFTPTRHYWGTVEDWAERYPEGTDPLKVLKPTLAKQVTDIQTKPTDTDQTKYRDA